MLLVPTTYSIGEGSPDKLFIPNHQCDKCDPTLLGHRR